MAIPVPKTGTHSGVHLPASARSTLSVALVVDALTVFGGAERVLLAMLEVFPQARIFALVDFTDAHGSTFLRNRDVRTSFIQHLPFAAQRFRSYLQLWPIAVERLDVSGFDLVISSQYAVAHGVLTHPDQRHIVYSHSPMRYAWDLQNQYFNESSTLARLYNAYALRAMHKLRIWDFAAAQRVDGFMANSRFVASRINKYYRRTARVVYPPVDTDRFFPVESRENYYVTASRLVPYKRVDLIVEAFSRMPDRRLVVFGDGAELASIRAKAGPNVVFRGHTSNAEVCAGVARARAFIFAAVEDFGISPVEAQAAGVPVIALGKGGALETVRGLDDPEPTGVFFSEQTSSSLIEAVERFERFESTFSTQEIRQNALRFRRENFHAAFLAYVEDAMRSGRVNEQARARP